MFFTLICTFAVFRVRWMDEPLPEIAKKERLTFYWAIDSKSEWGPTATTCSILKEDFNFHPYLLLTILYIFYSQHYITHFPHFPPSPSKSFILQQPLLQHSILFNCKRYTLFSSSKARRISSQCTHFLKKWEE